jgi:hypothetical protein
MRDETRNARGRVGFGVVGVMVVEDTRGGYTAKRLATSEVKETASWCPWQATAA